MEIALEDIARPGQVNYLTQRLGEDGLSHLVETVKRLEEEWQLKLLGIAGNPSTSIALKVRREGLLHCLKVETSEELARRQVTCLGEWAKRGLAPVVAKVDAASGSYLLRWFSGKPVGERDLPDAGELLLRGWQTDVALPSGLGEGEHWDELFTTAAHRIVTFKVPLELELVDVARHNVEKLYQGAKLGTCHGDAVMRNILTDGSRLMLIDPTPHGGPLESVVAQLLFRALGPGPDLAEANLSMARFLRGKHSVAIDEGLMGEWQKAGALTMCAYHQAMGANPSRAMVGLARTLKPL